MNLTKQISRYSFALPLLFACVALSSCDNDKEIDPNLPVGPKATFSANALTAETRSASTRVALEPGVSVNNTDYLRWEVGDSFNFVFTNSSGVVGAAQDPFEVTDVDADYIAEIEGVIPAISGDGLNIISVYPFNPAFKNVTSAIVSVPSVQTQTADSDYSYLKNDLLLRAEALSAIDIVSSTDYDVKKTLNYKLLTSLLRFDIKNSTGQSISIKSLKLKVDDANINGTFYANGELDIIAGTFTGQGEIKELTLNVPNVVLPDDNQNYTGYLNVIPTDNVGDLVLAIDVVDEDDKVWSVELDLTGIVALKGGYRYNAQIIEILPEDLEDDCDDNFTPIEFGNAHGDWLFTPRDYFSYYENSHTFDNSVWVKAKDIPNISCPCGYEWFTGDFIWANTTYNTDKNDMLGAIGFLYGYINPDYSMNLISGWNLHYIYNGPGTYIYVSSVTTLDNGTGVALNANMFNDNYIQPRCVKNK